MRSRRDFRDHHFDPVVKRLTGTILEIGCGASPCATSASTANSVLLVDQDQARLRTCTERLTRPNVSVALSDIGRLPLRSGSVDAVIGAFVYCCIGDTAAVTRELSRVVRKGGVVVLLEHVRSRSRLMGFLQDLATPTYSGLFQNCHLNRNPTFGLTQHGFAIAGEWYSSHLMPLLSLVAVRQ